MNKLEKMISKTVNKVLGTMSQDESGGSLGSREVSQAMADAARQAAAEGIVLLKNDNGALPFGTDERISVFGRIQKDYFAVGYGSGGDVNEPYCINLIDGMKAAGMKTDSELERIYADWIERNPADHGFWGFWPRFHDEMPLDRETVASAAARSDAAVVIIGRSAGEDRENVLKKGSYYLTDTELDMLEKVTAEFKKTVVLLNCGNIIDMSWLESFGNRIQAVLLVWQGGMESGRAVADVLSGKISPSGKLSDTIASRYEDYPAANNFGKRKFNNYAEDIFVGYRYFETFKKDAVMFPFGFGLSYTEFDFSDISVECADGTATVSLSVKNTGGMAGKQVVEVYRSAPSGKLGKAKRELTAFCKTRLLSPGEEQQISMSFKAETMASYDDSGKSGFKNSYVLEEGEYGIYVGEDVRSCVKAGAYIQEKTVAVRRLSEPADCAPKASFERLTAVSDKNGSAMAAYEPVPLAETRRAQSVLHNIPEAPEYTGDTGIKLQDVVGGEASLADFAAQLDDKELEALCRGDYTMNSPLGTSGNAAVYGGILPSLRDKGVPPVTATDGPSGIRLHCYASLLPIGTLLACTWNTPLVEELYRQVGAEMSKKGSDVLLAPGMNIHRDPLCGRNFEYFSEDPLLTGEMGSAVVRGVQSNGVSACPKHFACNSQETNRTRTDSRVSQRALREIYLKGFEICVKEARPLNIMTSYNKLNGVWSHYHYGLCTQILRNEWGYDGCVMTDWWMRASRDPDFPLLRNNAYRVRAQVDVLMPGAGAGSRKRKYDPTLLESLGKDGGITRGEIFRSAVNTLRFVMRSKPFATENNRANTYHPGEQWFEVE